MLRVEVCRLELKCWECFPHLRLEFTFFDTVILFIPRQEGAPLDELVCLGLQEGKPLILDSDQEM